jgi:hypothetical protein
MWTVEWLHSTMPSRSLPFSVHSFPTRTRAPSTAIEGCASCDPEADGVAGVRWTSDAVAFVIAAIAPEAQVDPRGFDRAARLARRRLEGGR